MLPFYNAFKGSCMHIFFSEKKLLTWLSTHKSMLRAIIRFIISPSFFHSTQLVRKLRSFKISKSADKN